MILGCSFCQASPGALIEAISKPLKKGSSKRCWKIRGPYFVESTLFVNIGHCLIVLD